MRSIVAIGATSSIVTATLHCFAADGAGFLLYGRDELKLQAVASDLLARGASRVRYRALDLSSDEAPQTVFEDATAQATDCDLVYIGYGTLTDTKKAETNLGYAQRELINNFNSIALHALIWADYFAQQKRGALAVISSVAGDRGRQSNYVYGAAKAGLSTFLSGLRNRLAKDNVSVTTIKPGFIDTPMTAGIKKGPLFVSSELAGKIIYNGIRARSDVLYVPWFWRIILGIICAIPEKIFKKLSL